MTSQLLRQFGRPAFAYSGAQPQLLKVVEHARTADLYAGRVGGYFRDNSRIAPYNLYAHTTQLLAEAKGASKAHNIGFRFGRAPAGGRARASASVSYAAASFRFTWSRSKGRWLVWMDGQRAASTEGPQLSAATVVIQHTIVSTSRFLEWPGIRPPFAREHRVRLSPGAAGRRGLSRPLVAAARPRRHDLHHRLGSADDLRPRPGLDRARAALTVTPRQAAVRGRCPRGWPSILPAAAGRAGPPGGRPRTPPWV